VHQRFPYVYDDERDAPVILKNAREAREIADAEGVQIHTHVFRGDLEFAERFYGRETVLDILGPDVVLDHVNNISASEVALIAASQANVVTVTFVGETVGYGACPVIELLEAGANVAMATDGSAPYFSLDLWKEPSRTMFTHRIRLGDMAVLPPGKALRMVTIDAAKVLNLEHEIGSLEVGKKADVIVVDLRRPHLTPHASIPSLLAYYANGNDVETTIIDGKIVMENRVVKTVDEQEMLRLAMEEQRRAAERIDISNYTDLDDTFWRRARDHSGVVG
jgi:cytosine/adenosine deaminase-related metal-dependent hydrolase